MVWLLSWFPRHFLIAKAKGINSLITRGNTLGACRGMGGGGRISRGKRCEGFGVESGRGEQSGMLYFGLASFGCVCFLCGCMCFYCVCVCSVVCKYILSLHVVKMYMAIFSPHYSNRRCSKSWNANDN